MMVIANPDPSDHIPEGVVAKIRKGLDLLAGFGNRDEARVGGVDSGW
jgi:hypothetical protein